MYPTPNQHLKALKKLYLYFCVQKVLHIYLLAKYVLPFLSPPQNHDHFSTKILLKNHIKDEKQGVQR